MAITLAAIPAGSLWKQALVLAVVAIGITAAVYGVVALIVKADDVGLALAKSDRASAVGRALGRGIVRSMPVLLKLLSVVGTAAMIWVGGGIILHGLEVYGPPAIDHAVKAAAEAAAHAVPPVAGMLEWMVEAAISGVLGLLIGARIDSGRRICLRAGMEAAEAFLQGVGTARGSAAELPPDHGAWTVAMTASPGFRFVRAACEPAHLCLARPVL